MLEHLPFCRLAAVTEVRLACRGQAALVVGEDLLTTASVEVVEHDLTKAVKEVVQGLRSWVTGVAVVHRWKEEGSAPVVDWLVMEEAAEQMGIFSDYEEVEAAAEDLKRLGLGHLEFWEEGGAEVQ